MRATIQDPVGASLYGINTTKVYDYTLIIACGLAALGGVLSGALIIENPLMGQGMLLKGFAIVIVAGMGNLLGHEEMGGRGLVTSLHFQLRLSSSRIGHQQQVGTVARGREYPARSRTLPAAAGLSPGV